MKFEFGNTESKEKRDDKGRWLPGSSGRNVGEIKQKDRTCLFPICLAPANCRGLCRTHYTVALNCIKKKETTWKQLVKEGKVLEARVHNCKPHYTNSERKSQKEYFLSEPKRDANKRATKLRNTWFKPEEGDVRVNDNKSTSYRSFGTNLTEKETMKRVITLLVELRSLTDSFVFVDHEE